MEHAPNRSGFTLFELLGVIALMGIIVGTGALRYQEIREDWRLHAATRQIVLDLQEIRLHAIAEGVSHRLRFLPQTGVYRGQRREHGQYVDDAPPMLLPPGVTVAECTARADSVSFQPQGYASSFGTLTLVNTLGRRRQVVVDMVGRVRIR